MIPRNLTANKSSQSNFNLSDVLSSSGILFDYFKCNFAHNSFRYGDIDFNITVLNSCSGQNLCFIYSMFLSPSKK